MKRDIFCNKCRSYVGKIRDATLMKGIIYICPKCSGINSSSNKKKEQNDFANIFNSLFSSLVKWKLS